MRKIPVEREVNLLDFQRTFEYLISHKKLNHVKGICFAFEFEETLLVELRPLFESFDLLADRRSREVQQKGAQTTI